MTRLERDKVNDTVEQSCNADKEKLSDGSIIEVRINTLYIKLKEAFPSFLSSRDLLAKWLKDTFQKVIDNRDNLDSESKDNISMILRDITNEICTWVDKGEDNSLEWRVSWYIAEMGNIVETYENKVEDSKRTGLLDWLWNLLKKIPKPKWGWDGDKWDWENSDDDNWDWDWKNKDDDDKLNGWGFWWPDIK